MTTHNVVDDTQYAQEWREWRAGWEQYLAQPYGWLAVSSINWVDDEPQEFPGQPGVWWQQGRKLFVDPQGKSMTFDGESFTEVRGFDLSEAPDDTRILVEEFQIGITYRGQYLLVNYDPKAATRTAFDGVPTFDPDQHWVLKGRLEKHDGLVSVSFDSVGTDAHTYASRGVIRFNHDGQDYTLTPTETPDGGMAVVFADATSGVTTYGACRSIMVPEPGEDGTVVLDFNRALNLPCAFSGMPVCPAAPPGNRMPFAIEAGEKTPRETH
jgi:hypothetical protein